MNGKKKVLLIDDDDAVLAHLVIKLSKLYEVVSTVDPRQAVALARRELPDVILCDIDMPDMGRPGVSKRAPLAELVQRIDEATRL